MKEREERKREGRWADSLRRGERAKGEGRERREKGEKKDKECGEP